MFSAIASARALGLAVAAAAAFGATEASAYEVTGRFAQPQQIGYDGRLAVEASSISIISCRGPGEGGGQFWIYQYINRHGFRAILPPHWANALGGRDWQTFEQAATMACSGVAIAPVKKTPTTLTSMPHRPTSKGLRPVGSPSRGMTMGGEDHHLLHQD